MASNYPPGVTGTELQIAGPDYEEERELECPNCGVEAKQMVQGYRGAEWYQCESCKTVNDIVEDMEPEPDLEDDRYWADYRNGEGE